MTDMIQEEIGNHASLSTLANPNVWRPARRLREQLLTALSPATGKRRVWNRVSELETKLEESLEMNRALVRVGESLQEQVDFYMNALGDAYLENKRLLDRIDVTENQLNVAIAANRFNEHRTSVVAFNRFEVDPLHQATEQLSLTELHAIVRTVESDPNVGVGKVLQVDPETGDESTVEVPLDDLDEEDVEEDDEDGPKVAHNVKFDVKLLMAGLHQASFASPTNFDTMPIDIVDNADIPKPIYDLS